MDPDSPTQNLRFHSRRNFHSFHQTLIVGKQKSKVVVVAKVERWHSVQVGRSVTGTDKGLFPVQNCFQFILAGPWAFSKECAVEPSSSFPFPIIIYNWKS